MEIEKLPTEIAANIFSRLPFKSVLQCKCVSKYWCNLLQHLIYTSGERYFAKLHHSRIMDSSSSPDSILIMLEQSVDNNQTCVEDDDGDELHYVEYNEEDQNMGFNLKAMKKFNSPLKMDSKFWSMASSSNGLICSAHQTDPDDDSYLLYIYNPFVGEYVTLPNNFKHSSESSMAFGFGHIPSTDEYKVVRIVYPPGGGDDGNVEVYTLGGDKSSGNGKWRRKAYVVKYRLQCDSPGVLVNESLHWLTQKDEKTRKQNILVFNLVEEEFRRIPLPSVVSLGNGTVKIRELDGSLCVVDCLKEERKMFMRNLKKVDKENGYWNYIFGKQWFGGPEGYEHCFYWKKVDQSLLWMSNSSVVVEHHRSLGPKMDLTDTQLRQARLFHGIPHIKSFVSLTALGENDVKTIKDINRKRKRDNKQRRKQKRRGLYIVYSSDDE